MSRTLGLREDQRMGRELVERIVLLFPETARGRTRRHVNLQKRAGVAPAGNG